MTFYDAFAGIGGFRLGLERAGMKCVGSCEIDEYARKVYHKNFGEWPDKDIREVENINGADLLCGGFPCQDISVAGKGAGLSGERSGLWWELARIIEGCLPRWVFLENVPMLIHRGLREVVGYLGSCGYVVEWDCLPASAFGAPHQRDRIWIVAYSNEDQLRKQPGRSSGEGWPGKAFTGNDGKKKSMAYPISMRELQQKGGQQNKRRWISDCGWWASEPNVGRVAHGVPNRVDRLKCLGNAVVPQVVEWIGRRIIMNAGRSYRNKKHGKYN